MGETSPYAKTDYYRAIGVYYDGLETGQFGEEGEPWDAIAMMPGSSNVHTPLETLEITIERCRSDLEELGFEITSEVEFTNHHYRLYRDGDGVYWEEWESPGWPKPVLINFGSMFMGRSTEVVRLEVTNLREGEGLMLLEPAYVLLALVQWLREVKEVHGGDAWRDLPSMFVECAGAEYSPGGNGKFDDVPRWEVHPPRPGRKGVICLNWNWNTRARPAQGVAVARLWED